MKVAILGFGVEGKSAYEYFGKQGAELAVFDERLGADRGVVSLVGDFSEINYTDFDLIVRSPSISPKKIKEALKEQKSRAELTSVTELFFEKCGALIIGVTGTKGKGTTCSLITEILKASGKKVWLVGNIGRAALDILDEVKKDDMVVYELSSFQLWDLKMSPKIAVITHIEADHLDVHEDMGEYLKAKENIVRWQTSSDVVIFDKTDEDAKSIAGRSKAERVSYPTGEFKYELEALRLPGEHNRKNAEAAILAAGRAMELSKSDKELDMRDVKISKQDVMRGLAAFNGLPHRLQFIREWRGVSFHDDSISTTPGSTIAAIRAFSAPKILILGGSSKGANFKELAKVVATNKVKQVIAIGVSANEIEQELRGQGFESVLNLGRQLDMTGIVQELVKNTEKGDVVILSPACASFDMFKNYGERGDLFRTAVLSL